MNRKPFYITSLLLILLTVVVLMVVNNLGTKTKKSDRDPSSINKPEAQISDDEGLLGRSDIPFKEYRRIYNESPPYNLVEFDPDECREKGTNFGYSFIEFIFIERSEDGSLKPYDISSIKYEDLSFNNQCPGAARNFHSTRKQYATCRIRFAIVRDCERCAGVLEPGETYRFYAFEGVGEVDYKIEVPEVDELNFVKPGSEKKPDVFRYPIFVSDIQKTKQTEHTRRKRATFTIRNVSSSELTSKIGDLSKIIVKYTVNNISEQKSGRLGKNDYAIDLTVPANQNIFGGSVKVFGLVNNSKLQSNERNPKSNRVALQMLRYKDDITTQEVDMSEGLGYRHEADKTVVKEVPVKPYIQTNNHLKTSNDTPVEVVLKKKFRSKREAIGVCKTVTYKKNDNWFVRLEAVPGDYALVIDNRIVNRNLNWPPE